MISEKNSTQNLTVTVTSEEYKRITIYPTSIIDNIIIDDSFSKMTLSDKCYHLIFLQKWPSLDGLYSKSTILVQNTSFFKDSNCSVNFGSKHEMKNEEIVNMISGKIPKEGEKKFTTIFFEAINFLICKKKQFGFCVGLLQR